MDESTRSSLDQMERVGYLPALRSIAKSACVPFWWHGITEDGTYRVHHNGTVCFLRTKKRLIAVTAWHVFDAYRKAKEIQPDIRCQFGSHTTEPESRLIAESKYLDLATFEVSDLIVTASGAFAHTPIDWPTRMPSQNEVLLYGGFPGSLREERSETVELPFQWFAGAPISVTPENVKLHIDWNDFHQPLHGPSMRNTELGGMSGGPMFRFIPGPPIERLELVGFIYEAQPSLSLVFARPAHYLSEDGQLEENVL